MKRIYFKRNIYTYYNIFHKIHEIISYDYKKCYIKDGNVSFRFRVMQENDNFTGKYTKGYVFVQYIVRNNVRFFSYKRIHFN